MEGVWSDTWVLGADTLAFYLLLSGLAYLWFGVVRRRAWQPRRIQQGPPPGRSIAREIAWSVSSAAVFGFVVALTTVAARNGFGLFYREIDEYGTLYFWTSIAILLILHDAYFYWTHRLLHSRWLFEVAHAVHHRSTNPSAFASLSFHPIEAAIQVSFIPFAGMLIPLTPHAIGLWFLIQLIFNISAHKGYEMLPRGFGRSRAFDVLNSSVHHNLHHRLGHGNYGLYTGLWDHLMGTRQQSYREAFERVHMGTEPEPIQPVRPDARRTVGS